LKWEVVNELNMASIFSLVDQKLRGDMTTIIVLPIWVFYAPIATGGGVAELLSNMEKCKTRVWN
jgi:hypothetical protein